MSAPEPVVRAIRSHHIECTSKADGMVTCAGCREKGWIHYGDFIKHQADAAFAASLEWAASIADHCDPYSAADLRRWARGDAS